MAVKFSKYRNYYALEINLRGERPTHCLFYVLTTSNFYWIFLHVKISFLTLQRTKKNYYWLIAEFCALKLILKTIIV